MAFDLKLDSLELTNFHKFERYSIDFDESMTVLVGDNGSGKSSILDAAAVSLSTVVSQLSHQPAIRLSSSDARLSFYDMEGFTDRQEQYPVTISARGRVGEGPQDEHAAWSYVLKSSDDNAFNLPNQQLQHLLRNCTERIQSGDSSLVLPVAAYYGTSRLHAHTQSGRNRRSKPFSRQDGYSNALDATIGTNQMLDWFFKMTAQNVQRSQSLRPAGESKLFVAVRTAIEQCFQSITGSKRVNVTYNLDTDDLDIEYFDNGNEVQRMSLSLLSDGYRTTLSMVADIAYRMALLNPALGEKVLSETPGIVLIDEVDLHLHPLWQARILGDLRSIFPKVQFIVTTHAPIVISSVGKQHIRLLNNDEEAQVPSAEVYGSDVGRVLISVMGAPERPEGVQRKFDEFYNVLGVGDFDQARTLLDELVKTVGNDDTDVVGAQTALSLEEADARYAAD